MSLLVYITTPSEAEAFFLAERLVERRLAAGVNIVPGARSVYRWKGEICRAQETLLLAQTSVERFLELRAAVRELHSYETPCVLAVPIACADPDFGHWIARETEKDE